MKLSLFVSTVFLSLSSLAFAADIQSEIGAVKNVRLQHWATDVACVNVGSRWFKLDLGTKIGTSTYAMALAALTSGKLVQVVWNEENPLEGGCDTGTTMHPIYAIQVMTE